MKMKCMAALSVALLMMAGTAFAADEQDPWRFGVAVPIWAAGIEGDVTVRGHQQDIDIGFDKIKDHLETAVSLSLEARKERFGFYAGFGYMKFTGDDRLARGGEAEAEMKLLIGDAGVAYRLVKAGQELPFILEATAGARYWHTDTDLKLTNPNGAVLFHGGKKRDLVDPIIGLRGSQFLTRKFHLDFQGDIGGFGITDDTSDLDWSATGALAYDFTNWFSLAAGYKALSLDFENDSGAKKHGADFIMHGLLLSAKFSF